MNDSLNVATQITARSLRDSLNAAVTDSLPSRAPADQGRERKGTGKGIMYSPSMPTSRNVPRAIRDGGWWTK